MFEITQDHQRAMNEKVERDMLRLLKQPEAIYLDECDPDELLCAIYPYEAMKNSD